ncbi:MAG: deoxyhypusine synthase [Calditrichaeota bacterium]|nr:deoxyhypusine synthase [Calditrichota bacterium]
MAKRSKSPYLRGPRIKPAPITGSISVTELVDKTFLAYNAARLREAARLLVEKVLREEVTVGLSLSGALTPAGLGLSCVVPLIEHGFVDWITSTGANLYHDAHFALDLALHAGSPFVPDPELRKHGVIRIYDVLFDYEVLLTTDRYLREVTAAPEFDMPMTTAQLHHLLGKYLAKRNEALGVQTESILVAAYKHGVPVYTPSPGDSSIGMNLAELSLRGRPRLLDVMADVNETAAIVYDAKRKGGKSAVFILGGGAPKNFLLQTEPQIQEVLAIPEKGHDYFIQITDARPDTGGLSGATPSEAVSWGKVNPAQLPDTVVCYVDTTVALPLLTAYVLANAKPRAHKRLYDRRDQLLQALRQEFQKRQRRKR